MNVEEAERRRIEDIKAEQKAKAEVCAHTSPIFGKFLPLAVGSSVMT